MDAFLNLEAAILLFFQEHVRVGFLSLILTFLTVQPTTGYSASPFVLC